MKTQLKKILNLSRYFNVINWNEQTVKYTFKKPCFILLQNIQANWLKSILQKTHKFLPIYINSSQRFESTKVPFGFINQKKLEDQLKIFEHNLSKSAPKEETKLILNIIVPEANAMQTFIQWQRYRKYWWSSITTTPSLFQVDDIKHGDKTADVNIVAKFPWDSEVVETINIQYKNNTIQETSHLSCSISLEKALFILLVDGATNCTKEGYLRLHRNMAPYQMSFALENGTDSDSKKTLEELATVLHSHLIRKKISTWLPDFSLALESQLSENLQVGSAYTAILNQTTLSNGIFHLLNSSTMLKEQVHVADLVSYAELLCRK